MLQLFWLLLPVAALSGWLLGRRERSGGGRASSSRLPGGYLQGLNYLLNEQQDKAIEVFTRLIEVDSDTAELHLALGSLFRRRGEVERAIRIHQNLIARPSMTREQRAYALLELGLDYMKAGLLDRAEALFQQVADFDAYVVPALHQLLIIHQRHRDWEQAIATAKRLEGHGAPGMRPLIAHFYCEQAELALQRGDARRAQQLLKKALASDPGCVRASLQLGLLQLERGNHRAALRSLANVERQDPAFLPEVLEPMQECYTALRQPDQMQRELERLADAHPETGVSLALAEVIRERQGVQAAVSYLLTTLRRAPTLTGIGRLLELIAERGGQAADVEELQIIRAIFDEVLAGYNDYECRQCGFSGRTLHWQCPSCRSWGTVKPLLI
ncbi:MAG: lipopolysaccharide assembly protein LapB [Xanthomonadaceae bacterium]|nr:lipopolysaccharide assembly protein LapB [Xanthomonadaceae bacterium]